jgi:hypothetical protein
MMLAGVIIHVSVMLPYKIIDFCDHKADVFNSSSTMCGRGNEAVPRGGFSFFGLFSAGILHTQWFMAVLAQSRI